MNRNYIKHIILLSMTMAMMASCSVKNSFTFFPDKDYIVKQEQLPFYIEELAVTTDDNKKLQALYYKHNDHKSEKLIVYFHGNAGNLFHRMDYAQRIYEMGFDVLLASYRGYAQSSGKPSEKGIYSDGAAVLDYAIGNLNYKMSGIIIMGRSLGSTVAVEIAQNKTPAGVILITPLTSGKEMAEAMGMKYLKFIAGDSYNSIAKIDKLSSPLLIIHGDKDEVVPYKMGLDLYEKYPGSKKFVTIPNGGHNNLQDVQPKLFWTSIYDFIAACKASHL